MSDYVDLIIVRGVCGSGKSTFAKTMFPNHTHAEADMYFYDNDGNYKFDQSKLTEAHDMCFEIVADSLKNGISAVVSNTFTKKWEMAKYISLANIMNIHVTIYRMETQYDNVHNVPEEVVQKMKDRMEKVEGELIVTAFQLKP